MLLQQLNNLLEVDGGQRGTIEVLSAILDNVGGELTLRTILTLLSVKIEELVRN